jgi:hypothetical protein
MPTRPPSLFRACLRAVVASVALGAPPLAARAQPAGDASARTCIDAHYESQKLRSGAKLVEARKRLVACSQEACPAVISRECAEWLVEVDKTLPTLVLKATDALDHDVTEINATENGAPFPLRPDGKPVAVDPGPHTYRFEYGGQTVEMNVVVREGELRRVLQVVFDQVPVPRVERRGESRGPHFTLPSLVLGGVGVAGVGASLFLGLSGRADYDQLRDECSPRCDPKRRDDVDTKLLAADIALGVGLASLGVATIVFLTSGDVVEAPAAAPGRAAARRRPPPIGWSFGPTPNGGLTSLFGTF